MFWLKLCRLNLYRICFKFEAPSYICRWNYINDLPTYLRQTFYTKYQSLCVWYYHNMLDDPDFTQSTSDCVYYYHNMLHDRDITQSTSHCVHTIIIICLMIPDLHKIPVTVCIVSTWYVWWPRFYIKYQSLCVYYYLNMFDDPGFVLSCYVSLCSVFRVVISVTISAWKRYSVRLYLQLFVGGLMSYYVICACLHTMSNTYCVVFLFCLS
jgi:hypothetical protein